MFVGLSNIHDVRSFMNAIRAEAQRPRVLALTQQVAAPIIASQREPAGGDRHLRELTEQARENRRVGPEALERLRFWQKEAGLRPHQDSFWQPLLDHANVKEFSSFLERQKQTPNYLNDKRNFARHLVRYVVSMVENEGFCEEAFDRIRIANISCDDREAYAFDEVATCWERMIGLKDASDLDIASFLIGLGRKKQLDKRAETIEPDPLEAYLYLQIVLSNPLKFYSVTRAMIHEYRTGLSLKEAIEMGTDVVLKTHQPKEMVRILVADAVWQERLRLKDEEGRYSAIAQQVFERTQEIARESNPELRIERENCLKAETARQLDELYTADTEKWLCLDELSVRMRAGIYDDGGLVANAVKRHLFVRQATSFSQRFFALLYLIGEFVKRIFGALTDWQWAKRCLQNDYYRVSWRDCEDRVEEWDPLCEKILECVLDLYAGKKEVDLPLAELSQKIQRFLAEGPGLELSTYWTPSQLAAEPTLLLSPDLYQRRVRQCG